jgi:hypothetical protein
MPKRWLVISNCQTVGLANCLSLLCPKVNIDTCDIHRFKSETEEWSKQLSDYDELIAIPKVQTLGFNDFSERSNVTYLPVLIFRGFHPDLTYVVCNDKVIKGPMDDYHSIVVFLAYKLGLSESQACQLFSARPYKKVDLPSIWETEKQTLFQSFRDHGFEITRDFIKWIRDGSFMHSVNHPKIGALYDIAKLVAEKLGAETIANSLIRPHDNLLVGPIWPIYPEIADELALTNGSYLFKTHDSYRLFDLNEFIAGSYSSYRAYHADDLHAKWNPYYDLAAKTIQELL